MLPVPFVIYLSCFQKEFRPFGGGGGLLEMENGTPVRKYVSWFLKQNTFFRNSY